MRSKYGMVTNFFSSAQKYDSKKVFKSLVWCAETHNRFSRAPQSQTVGCVKHNFWDTSETLLQNQVGKGYENSKIAPTCLTLSGPRKFSVRFRTPN